MQHWQLPFLGLHEFPADLTAFEIRYFFTFTPHEREAILSRYGDHHRLAAAVQLGFLKMTGRTLDAFDPLPISVLRHLRSCCKIPHAHRFSNSRIMLIWIIAALLEVNLS